MFGHLSSTRRWVTISTTTLLLLAGLTITLFSPIVTHMGTAHADTNCDGYGVKYAGSSWLTSSGGGVNICNPGGGKPYCLAVSNAPGDTHCPKGYVWSGDEWQCVEMVNRLYLTKGWTKATWYGDGNTLINSVPSGLTEQNNGSISYVNPGDVITLNGYTKGHAGIINTIDSNGTIHIKNQNADLDSSAYISSGSLSSGNATYSMAVGTWSGYSVQAIVHHPPPPLPLRIGVLTSHGSYLVKQGGLSAYWTDEYDGASQGMISGDVIGVVGGGIFKVKEGGLSAPWTTESTSAVAGVVSDETSTTPLRIGYVSSDGHFYVKEKSLSANWTDEYSGVVAGYLSGTRIGVLTSNGTFLVKDGGLSAQWTTEGTGISQGMLSGSLIGEITTGGAYYVKQGSLSANWTTQYSSGAVVGIVSDVTTNTPLRVGLLDTNGTLLVKEISLSGSWVTEATGTSQGVISGNLIGVLEGTSFNVKQGGLGAIWVDEYDGVTAGSLWSL